MIIVRQLKIVSEVSIDCMVERGLFLRDDTKNRMLVLA
jgi:hypothetical protein